MNTNNLFIANKPSFFTAKKLLITLISTSMYLTAFAENSTTATTKSTTVTKHTKKPTKTTDSTATASTKSTTTTKHTKKSDSTTTTTHKRTTFNDEDLTVADNVDCEDGTPCLVVSTTSREVLKEINEKQVSAITDTVLPHFDFRLMTKYALGHNWKEATDEQQDQIVKLFKQLLIYTYSTALSKFGGAKIHITSSAVNPSGKTAVVVSMVSLPSSATNNTNQPVKLEYNLANNTGEWKAYDIKIENASLVTTYRNQFNEIVQKDKIQGLIRQLQTKVDSLKKTRASNDENS